MRYVIIKDGKVFNTIVLEAGAEWSPPEGCAVVADPDGVESAKFQPVCPPKKGRPDPLKALKNSPFFKALVEAARE